MLLGAAAASTSLGVDRNSPASWTVSDTRMANRAAESLPDGLRPKFYSCLNAKTWLVFPRRMGTLQLKGRLMAKSSGQRKAESLAMGTS